MKHRLKNMEETLINCVQSQLGDLSSVDAKELGEAVDMIKDFAEAIYYCTITEAMGEEKEHKYYTTPMYYPPRDMDKANGRMYYDSVDIRDYREGNSPMVRKNYMEHKEMHRGKEVKMQELEKYMHELTNDITEMIADASPEEKQLLQRKVSALATKIV